MDCGEVSGWTLSDFQINWNRLNEKFKEKEEEYLQSIHNVKQINTRNDHLIEHLKADMILIEKRSDDIQEKYGQLETLNNSLRDKIEYKEKELACVVESHQAEVDDIRHEAAMKSKVVVKPEVQVADNSKLLAEIDIMKHKISNLKLKLEESDKKFEQVNIENLFLKSNISELERNYDEKEDALKSLKHDLAVQMAVYEELREELLLSKTEVTTLQSGAVVKEERGNSLFSEVEDNRLVLQKRYADLKGKYIALHELFNRKNIDLSKLSAEKAGLLRRIQDITKDIERHDNDLTSSFETRIRELNQSNRKLIAESRVPIKIISDDMNSADRKFIEGYVANSRKTVLEMQEKLQERSIACLHSEQIIHRLRLELIRGEAKLLKYNGSDHVTNLNLANDRLWEAEADCAERELERNQYTEGPKKESEAITGPTYQQHANSEHKINKPTAIETICATMAECEKSQQVIPTDTCLKSSTSTPKETKKCRFAPDVVSPKGDKCIKLPLVYTKIFIPSVKRQNLLADANKKADEKQAEQKSVEQKATEQKQVLANETVNELSEYNKENTF